MKTINAKDIHSNTLVGSSGEFPRDSGNCMTVVGEDGEIYRILNFNYENLKHLISLGLKWPIAINVIERPWAVLHDARIGDRWYSDRFCTVCTPQHILPLPQRLKQLRRCVRGQREENAGGWVTEHLGGLNPPQFQ